MNEGSKLPAREEARRAIFLGVAIGLIGTIFSEPDYSTASLFERSIGTVDFRWILALSLVFILYGVWTVTKDKTDA